MTVIRLNYLMLPDLWIKSLVKILPTGGGRLKV